MIKNDAIDVIHSFVLIVISSSNNCDMKTILFLLIQPEICAITGHKTVADILFGSILYKQVLIQHVGGERIRRKAFMSHIFVHSNICLKT